MVDIGCGIPTNVVLCNHFLWNMHDDLFEVGSGHCIINYMSTLLGIMFSFMVIVQVFYPKWPFLFLTIFRYKLKKRFDRGSYGEVWLAFHWNCSEDNVHKEPRHFTATPKSDSYNCTNSNTMPSNEDHVSDTVDGDLFILKRIMVN